MVNFPSFNAEAALGPTVHKYRGRTQIGSHTIQSARGVVAAQIPEELEGSCYDECYSACIEADGSPSVCEEQCSLVCSEEVAA